MSFETSEIVTKNIRQLMTNYHITQKDLASMIGVSTASISERFNLKIHMDIDAMTDIAKVFSVPVESLLVKDNFKSERDLYDLNDRAVSHLRSAIIMRAVKDYCRALLNDDTRSMLECQRFFKGSWAFQLSPVVLDDKVAKLPGLVEDFKAAAIKSHEDGVVTISPRSGDDRVLGTYRCPICGKWVYTGPAVKNMRVRKNVCLWRARCSGCDLTYEIETGESADDV